MTLTQWANAKNPPVSAMAKKAKMPSVRRTIARAIRHPTGLCSLPVVITIYDIANRVPLHVVFCLVPGDRKSGGIVRSRHPRNAGGVIRETPTGGKPDVHAFHRQRKFIEFEYVDGFSRDGVPAAG